ARAKPTIFGGFPLRSYPPYIYYIYFFNEEAVLMRKVGNQRTLPTLHDWFISNPCRCYRNLKNNKYRSTSFSTFWSPFEVLVF
ncbi:MAG: hypothetical protein KAI83_01965, partial [Thiomargarita sp.]|nr:hypothetical protein [Thiomargarita sp.]